MGFGSPTFPSWATETNFPAGGNAWSGQPCKVAPTGDLFTPGTKPPAEWFNSIFSNIAGDISNLFTNALDKAGDTISTGTINIAGGGQISANTSAAILANFSNSIAATVANGIVSNISGGIAPLAAGGITTNVAQGIYSSISQGIVSAAAGGITGGTNGAIQPNVAGGINDGGVFGGIQATVPGGVRTLSKIANVTSSYTILTTDRIVLISAGANTPFLLPATPVDGEEHYISDYSGITGSGLVLGGNGKNIYVNTSAASSITITPSHPAVNLIYSAAIGAWAIIGTKF